MVEDENQIPGRGLKGETFSARQKTVAGQLLPITKYKQSQ